MHVLFPCPRCQAPQRAAIAAGDRTIGCRFCDWSRELHAGESSGRSPGRCLVCGCDDLWRQKDFPVRLGLLFVGLGVLGSTIAWLYYYPLASIGILMGFALFDLVLFCVMPDVLVCYRCGGRHGDLPPHDEHPPFDLETAERYRQEARRVKESA